jgi:glycerophosphoryl diester phosphodiesterase
VLILLHNEFLDATTNVTGLASDWNYTDLIAERVDFGYDNPTEDTVLAGEREYFTVNGERRFPTDVSYPDGVEPRDEKIYLATTLEELLVAFPKNRISVEIKQSGELGLKAVAEAIRLIEKHDAFDRVILASFHGEIFREFRRLQKQNLVPDEFMYSPGIMGIAKYYALTVLGIDSLYLDGVSVLQLPMEEVGVSFATRRVVDTAHRHNLAVHYWTINNEDEMRTLIELGVDAIMTDKPSLLKNVLEEYK